MEATKDYRAYATKAVTPTMEAFADFLIAEVYGGTLPAGTSREVFVKSVALGGSLRMDFQRSDYWKSDSRNYLANVEATREAKAREALERANATAAKAAKRAADAKAKLEAAAKATAAKAAESNRKAAEKAAVIAAKAAAK